MGADLACSASRHRGPTFVVAFILAARTTAVLIVSKRLRSDSLRPGALCSGRFENAGWQRWRQPRQPRALKAKIGQLTGVSASDTETSSSSAMGGPFVESHQSKLNQRRGRAKGRRLLLLSVGNKTSGNQDYQAAAATIHRMRSHRPGDPPAGREKTYRRPPGLSAPRPSPAAATIATYCFPSLP